MGRIARLLGSAHSHSISTGTSKSAMVHVRLPCDR
jgi:hypothetical protein